MKNQFALFGQRRFFAFFFTQFLGAYNDNLFKSALVTLITYRLAAVYHVNAQMLITVVAGLFILPFFLFSSLAGQICDKYEKAFLIRKIKFVEIILMCMTAAAFETMQLWWLVFLLFCMGTQSSFFGPLKYSILPQLLSPDELIAGNGLVNAGTNIAILTGTLCGGLLILSPLGRHYISIGIIGVAVAGYAASLFIPSAPAASPGLRIDPNIFRSTWQMLLYPLSNKPVFTAVLGISWFWFIGSVFLAQFPSYAKDVIGGDEQVSTLFLIIFSIGVGLGATCCNTLLKGRVSGRYLPKSLAAMSVFIVALYYSSSLASPGDSLITVASFFKSAVALPIVASMLLLAVSGGIYSVPMYAIMQAMTPPTHLARVIASLNVFTSVYMVTAALLCMAMIGAGASIMTIFLTMAALNITMMPLARSLAKLKCE